MLIGNLYGRLGADPVARLTKNGHDMATVSVAVDVTAWQAEEPETLWVSILCFGAQAEILLRASQGEMITAIGKLTRHDYTHPETGEVRENWTLVAESVLTTSSSSARTGGGRKKRRHHQEEGQLKAIRHQCRKGRGLLNSMTRFPSDIDTTSCLNQIRPHHVRDRSQE